MNVINYTVKLRHMWNDLDWKFSGIFVHIFNNLILVDNNGIDNICQILLFMVQMAQRESKTLSLQDIPAVATDHGLFF